MSGQKVSILLLASRWQSVFAKKKELFSEKIESPLECLRLLHSESDPLRVDKVGSTLVMGWWSPEPPSPSEISEIKAFAALVKPSHWYLKWRPPKGVQKNSSLLLEGESAVGETWVFHESGVRFQARKSQGDAFGLFLDQRDNRRWVGEQAQGKDVLNLFSFTCGFSLFAALGGARSVDSVDLYAKYLDWGADNFRLNGLKPENYGFYQMDSFKFLGWAAKKDKMFDLIICDPPSFSRNGRSIFKIEKDYENLLNACFQVLRPQGQILFSSNFEKWAPDLWKGKFRDMGISRCRYIRPQEDFEGALGVPIQKSFLLSSNGTKRGTG